MARGMLGALILEVYSLAAYSIAGASWGFQNEHRQPVGVPGHLGASDPSLRAPFCGIGLVTSYGSLRTRINFVEQPT